MRIALYLFRDAISWKGVQKWFWVSPLDRCISGAPEHRRKQIFVSSNLRILLPVNICFRAELWTSCAVVLGHCVSLWKIYSFLVRENSISIWFIMWPTNLKVSSSLIVNFTECVVQTSPDQVVDCPWFDFARSYPPRWTVTRAQSISRKTVRFTRVSISVISEIIQRNFQSQIKVETYVT